jgi:hypothetical protein
VIIFHLIVAIGCIRFLVVIMVVVVVVSDVAEEEEDDDDDDSDGSGVSYDADNHSFVTW